MLVAIQFILFVIYFWNPLAIRLYKGNSLKFIALIISLMGVIILFLALYALRKSLSPFPSPKRNADLVINGIYKFARHPIYTSILFLTFGWAFYSNSLFRILVFFLFIILFEIKSNYEEKLLINKFNTYQQYMKITGKYFPKIN